MKSLHGGVTMSCKRLTIGKQHLMTRTTSLIPLLLICTLVTLWSCGESVKEPAPAARCNVLFITLDTVRADRLGCYGCADAETPTLDRLARKGVLFEQAMTPVPITLPSHTTMMTGLLPPEHGVRENDDLSLGAGVPTMAELFKAADYTTGAFIAAFVLDAVFGLERGFDTYDDEMGSAENLTDKRLDKERPADRVVDAALAWLEEKRSAPFFCWVHLFDAHAPYAPPAPFDTRFAGRPYDGEIAFVDSQIERLVDWLARKGLAERTLIVIAGDHGEGMGDHGELRHSVFLYDATMRVPVIFSLPGIFADGVRVSEPVGLVDLLPTVIAAVGLEEPNQPLRGESLLAAFHGPDGGQADGGRLKPRAQYGESNYPFDYYGWSPLRSLTTWQWKYIRAPRPELYDRRSDRAESLNLADQRKEVVNDLDRRLTRMEKAMFQRKTERLNLSDAQRRRLAALGYTASGSSAALPKDWKKLKDPKDMATVLGQWIVSLDLLAAGRTKEAIAHMKKIVDQNPGTAQFHSSLASSLFLAGDTSGSADQFRLAVDAHVASGLGDRLATAQIYAGYGLALTRLGSLDDAVIQYERALAIDPTDSEVLNNLGTIFYRSGRLLESVMCFGDACARTPDNTSVQTNLNRAKQTLGQYAKRYEDGLNVLRRGKEIRGSDPIIVDIKARALAACPEDALRDSAAALEAAEEACAATARQNPVCLDTLAIVHASAGRFEKAIAVSKEAMAIAQRHNVTGLVDDIGRRVKLYEARQPYRLIP